MKYKIQREWYDRMIWLNGIIEWYDRMIWLNGIIELYDMLIYMVDCSTWQVPIFAPEVCVCDPCEWGRHVRRYHAGSPGPAAGGCQLPCLVIQAGPGRVGRQLSSIDIYHTILYHGWTHGQAFDFNTCFQRIPFFQRNSFRAIGA